MQARQEVPLVLNSYLMASCPCQGPLRVPRRSDAIRAWWLACMSTRCQAVHTRTGGTTEMSTVQVSLVAGRAYPCQGFSLRAAVTSLSQTAATQASSTLPSAHIPSTVDAFASLGITCRQIAAVGGLDVGSEVWIPAALNLLLVF